MGNIKNYIKYERFKQSDHYQFRVGKIGGEYCRIGYEIVKVIATSDSCHHLKGKRVMITSGLKL